MRSVAGGLMFLITFARVALADGGVPIVSLQAGHGRCTLVMQPAQAVVGPVVFEVLGAGDGPLQVTLLEATAGTATPVPLSRDAVTGHWRGETRLDAAGEVEIALACGDGVRGVARLTVGPAPLRWQVQWPWLLGWLAPGSLLVLRQRSLRRRIYTARASHA